MALRTALPFAAFAAAAFACTDILLPLYVYPGGAGSATPDWQAAVDAIKSNPETHFYVIINPNDGPLGTSDPTGNNGGYCNAGPDGIPHGCNRDWTTHLGAINALPNAQTLGYVYTSYGNTSGRSTADVEGDVLEWSQWDTAPTWAAGATANISIYGIFFDEVSSSASSAPFYRDLATYANQTFDAKSPADRGLYSVFMNPGTNPDRDFEAALFNMSSAVVTQEACFTTRPSSDCPLPYTPFNSQSLAPGNGLPYDLDLLGQSSILVHGFADPGGATVATLCKQIEGVISLGVHSTYFTTGGWNTTTSTPATIGMVAHLISEKNNVRSCPSGCYA